MEWKTEEDEEGRRGFDEATSRLHPQARVGSINSVMRSASENWQEIPLMFRLAATFSLFIHKRHVC